MSIEVLSGGWKSWIFGDVDPSGSMIITTPHLFGGPMLVRSFPSLEVVRSVEPPPGEGWTERVLTITEFPAGGR